MTRNILGFLLVASMTTSASASNFCEQVGSLTLQAKANFILQPTEFPYAERCTLSRAISGANAYHCAWSFSYRDVAAQQTFDNFTQMMRTCFEGSPEVVEDTGVNHPDSYFQRQHLLNDAVISISIKDKTALQKTYVFLGIQRRNLN